MINILLENQLGIYSQNEVQLNEGLTIVTGCNGSGKSTFVDEIIRNFEEQNIKCSHLDCNKQFHISDLSYIEDHFNMMTVLQKGYRSEHEYYEDMFSDWSATIRPGDEFIGKKYAIVVDGLDSGGDVIFYRIHTHLFELIVNDAKKRGIKIYLVATCNNFYYLSQAKSGEALFMPMFERRQLPVYTSTEFDNYVADIRRTAKARGFQL